MDRDFLLFFFRFRYSEPWPISSRWPIIRWRSTFTASFRATSAPRCCKRCKSLAPGNQALRLKPVSKICAKKKEQQKITQNKRKICESPRLRPVTEPISNRHTYPPPPLKKKNAIEEIKKKLQPGRSQCRRNDRGFRICVCLFPGRVSFLIFVIDRINPSFSSPIVRVRRLENKKNGGSREPNRKRAVNDLLTGNPAMVDLRFSKKGTKKKRQTSATQPKS